MYTIGQLKNLITELKLPDSCGVILSGDSEGNDFHPMANQKNITLVSYSKTNNLIKYDTKMKNAIILWPEHISIEEE